MGEFTEWFREWKKQYYGTGTPTRLELQTKEYGAVTIHCCLAEIYYDTLEGQVLLEGEVEIDSSPKMTLRDLERAEVEEVTLVRPGSYSTVEYRGFRWNVEVGVPGVTTFNTFNQVFVYTITLRGFITNRSERIVYTSDFNAIPAEPTIDWDDIFAEGGQTNE